ncbi:helix-turn-helix transcriptional regulator [Salimicrobium halophilum]|uniref:Helix-turn-helix domain-containing protein n=1 Tax=Salimicrobium halophilum TaxID=86666 RepID=A0A1G8WFA9_9BACI|nr:helix-turn-helix transcriptional regulator [Salimicrobium halophilum]SDJ76964.1 Helix-turn-helix domain-containing protein [Salimicrobium halophilum]
MSKDLAARVKNELFRRDMRQKDLAEMLNVSSAYVSDIIHGRRSGEKAQKHIKQICKILDINKKVV